MLLQAYSMAYWSVANTTEFHIDFSFVVYNNRWQPWQAEFENLRCFITFQFSVLCVYIHNQQKLCL